MTDPLDFDPVPRKFDRHNGWTAERQRGFIRALAECGDVEKAAQSQGLTGNGAYQLRKRWDRRASAPPGPGRWTEGRGG